MPGFDSMPASEACPVFGGSAAPAGRSRKHQPVGAQCADWGKCTWMTPRSCRVAACYTKPGSIGLGLVLPDLIIGVAIGVEHAQHAVFPLANDLHYGGSGAPDVVQHPALALGLVGRLVVIREAVLIPLNEWRAAKGQVIRVARRHEPCTPLARPGSKRANCLLRSTAGSLKVSTRSI